MSTSVCSMCGLQNTDISEVSASFSEEVTNASSELHLRHSNSLNSVCKCNEHSKAYQPTSSLKCLDREICVSIKEEASDTSLNDVEMPVAVSTQRCSSVFDSPLNGHEFSESTEEDTMSHEQFEDVKVCVENKSHFHEKTPVRRFVNVKTAHASIGDGLSTCTVPRKNALSDESLDGEMVMSLPKKADKENSLQRNLKASLHHDLEVDEHIAIPKQQGLYNQGKSKATNRLHHSSNDQFDLSKDTWQSIRKTSNKYARVKGAPVTAKNLRNCKRSSGVRINDFDNQCDIVYISQPITECQFETQRSIISSRKTARKSTRGYFFNSEFCELSTVRTLFHGSKTGEIVNCSKLMKETLVFQKPSLSNNLSPMQVTAVASPGIVDFSVMPVACVLQGSPYREDKTDEQKLEFETCDTSLLLSRNSSPGLLAALCSQANIKTTNHETSVTFQCSSVSVPYSVKDDYTNLVESGATETMHFYPESSNEKTHQDSNIETVSSVLEQDFLDFSEVVKAVSIDDKNSDPCPSNPRSVKNSECSEITKSISFMNVPSCEITIGPCPSNSNSADKSVCPDRSTPVSLLDVLSCEIKVDSCLSNPNSVDKSKCPEICIPVSLLDVPSCEINVDPCPSNANSVDKSECPEISIPVSLFDVPSCEINVDPCLSNPNSVDKSKCPEISIPVSLLDVPSCEINVDPCPSNAHSVDKSECPEISIPVSLLDVPSCEINVDPCPSDANSVDKSECPEISTSVSSLDVPSCEINVDPCPSKANSVDKSECPEISTSVSFLDVPSCAISIDSCLINANSVDKLECPEISTSVSFLDVPTCEINIDPCPTHANSVNESECPEISASFSFLDVPSCEINIDPCPSNANSIDKSEYPEISTSVSFLDVPACEINLDSCPSNANSVDKSECSEISTSVSSLDVPSCEINLDPCPSNANSVDKPECSEISTSVSFLDVPSFEINIDSCPSNANSVDKSECSKISTSISSLDVPSCEINIDTCPSNANSVDKSECSEISTSVSSLDVPSCEINIDPCPSNANSVEKSECSEISTSVSSLDVPSCEINIDPCPSNENSVDKSECSAISTSVSFLDIPSCEINIDSCPSNPYSMENSKCPEIVRTLSSINVPHFEIHSDLCPNQNSVAKSEIAGISRPVSSLDELSCEIHSDQCPIDSNLVANSECPDIPRSAASLDGLPCEGLLYEVAEPAAMNLLEEDQNSFPKDSSEFEKADFVQSADCPLLGSPADADKVEAVDHGSDFLARSLFYEHPVDARLSMRLEEANEDFVDGQSTFSEASYDEESMDFKLDLSLEDTPGKSSVGSRDELTAQDGNKEMIVEVRRSLYSEETHEIVCNGTISPLVKMSDFKSSLPSDTNENVSCTGISLCISKAKEMLNCIENIPTCDSFDRNIAECVPASPSAVSVKETIACRPASPVLISDRVSSNHTCVSLSIDAFGEKSVDLSFKSQSEISFKSTVFSFPTSPILSVESTAAISIDCVSPFDVVKPYKSVNNMPSSPLKTAIRKESKSPKPCNASEKSSASRSNKTEKPLDSDQGKQNKNVINKLKMQRSMKLEMKKAKKKLDGSKKSFASASSSHKAEKQLDSDQRKESKKSLNKKKSKVKSQNDQCNESLENARSSNETEKRVVATQGKESKLLNKSKIEKRINLMSKGKVKQDDRKNAFASTSSSNKTEQQLTSDQGKKSKKLLNKPKISKSEPLEMSKNKSKRDDRKKSFMSTNNTDETEKQLAFDQGKENKKMLNKQNLPKNKKLEMSKAKGKRDDKKKSFVTASNSDETEKQSTSGQVKESKKLLNKPKFEKSVHLEIIKDKSKKPDHKNAFSSASSINETKKLLVSDKFKEGKKSSHEPKFQKSVNLEMSKTKNKQDGRKKSFVSAFSSDETEIQLASNQAKESKKLLKKSKNKKHMNLKICKNKSKQEDRKKSFEIVASINETEKQLASSQGKESKKLLNKSKIKKNKPLEMSKGKSKQDDRRMCFMGHANSTETVKQLSSDQNKSKILLNEPNILKSMNLEVNKPKSKQYDYKKPFVSTSSSNETGKERKKLLNKPKIKKEMNLEISKAKSKQDGRRMCFVGPDSTTETEKKLASDQSPKNRKLSNEPKILEHINLELHKAKSKKYDHKKPFVSASGSSETKKPQSFDQVKESKKLISKSKILTSKNLERSKAKSKQDAYTKSDFLKKSNAHKKILKRRKKKKAQKFLLKSDRCLRSQYLHSKADSNMEVPSTSDFRVPDLKISLVKAPGAKSFQRMVHIHRAISLRFTVDCFNRKLLDKMQDLEAEVYETSDDEFPVIEMPSYKSIQPQVTADGDKNWAVTESILASNNINQGESFQILVDVNSNERKVHQPKHCTDICPEYIELKSSSVMTTDLKNGKSKPIICKYEKNGSSTRPQTFPTTRSGKKPILSQTFMKHKTRILRNHKLKLDSTLERCSKSNLLTDGSLSSMEENLAHSMKKQTASRVNPLNVNKELTENNKEKYRNWFSEEEKQKRIADFNAKYLEVQKRWILLEKDSQTVHKVKNKSDKLKEIWRTKKRIRKVRHYSEDTKLSPVQVLFMKTFKLSDICKWFLETTETKSLVIVKKVSTRLPGDFPLPALPIQRYPSSIVYPPSAQAERLKKHLKKFASASPIKNNSKTQKMFAQYQDTFDSDSDNSDIVCTNKALDAINDVANSNSSESLKIPESVRTLRKYSSLREKLKPQDCLLESEKKDIKEPKEGEHCQSQKDVCVNPVISSNLVLQVQTGESWNKTERAPEDKRGLKRPHKFTNSDTKLDKKKKLQNNLSGIVELSSSSLKVVKASNKCEQNDFPKSVPSTRNQTALLCTNKPSEKPSLKGKKAKTVHKRIHKKSKFLLRGNIKKSKRKMANIELLLKSTKIKGTKKHSCKSKVKIENEPNIEKTQTRSMRRAEFQKIIMQNTKPDSASQNKQKQQVTK